MFGDRVVQDSFEARALSSKKLVSNYKSLYYDTLSPRINFKFSINGKDNELLGGMHHSVVVLPEEKNEKSIFVKFGVPYEDNTSIPAHTYLASGAKVTIKLDLREVFTAFNKDGFYTDVHGNKIYKENFNRVYITGNVKPLLCDFENLVNHPELEMKDRDGNHIYEIKLTFHYSKKVKNKQVWKLTKDISAFPAYSSPYVLTDALYNMALEELKEKMDHDDALKLEKGWIANHGSCVNYSVILSLAALAPEFAKNILIGLVTKERLLRRDGFLNDRALWVTAAWEVYKVSGDRQWLNDSYEIAKKALEEDRFTAFDPVKGLIRGKSSFVLQDIQTYPSWMQSAAIYESMATSTNAIHYSALTSLSAMAKHLAKEEDGKRYQIWADSLKVNINKKLWLNNKSLYAQYLYGGVYKSHSERSDALGQALAICFGVTDSERAQAIIANMPISSFGAAWVYPQIAYVPSYQNNAVWPFVQAYVAKAAAKIHNERAVLASLGAIYRASAMYLTNKEAFRADNGNYEPILSNEDDALSSLAGSLSLIYQVLFGFEFEPNGLRLNPYIPKKLRGERKLEGFKYRGAILDITLSGYGSVITAVTLDGNELKEALIPGNLKGRHALTIVLGDNQIPEGTIHLVPNHFTVDIPRLDYNNGKLRWPIIEGAVNYKVLKNGKLQTLTTDNTVNISQNGFAEYQVVAIDSIGSASFASAPYTMYSPQAAQLIEVENSGNLSKKQIPGYSGKGLVALASPNDTLSIPFNVPDTGLYVIDFRYADGRGNFNTKNNACKIHSLVETNRFLGIVVFPQKSRERGVNWCFSNKVVAQLNKGPQQLKLMLPPNTTVNSKQINENSIFIDYIRVIKIK